MARDHHVVVTGDGMSREHLCHRGAQPTAGAIARDRIADLVDKDPVVKAEIEALTRSIRREP